MAAQGAFLRVSVVFLVIFALGVSCSDEDPVRPPPSQPISVWMPVATGEPFQGVWGSPEGILFAVGVEGGILHSAGGTSEFRPSGTEARLVDIWGASSVDVFAVGHKPGAVGTIAHYNGHSWTEVLSRPGSYIAGVWGASPKDVFAVGYLLSTGHIYHFDGTAWSVTTDPHVLFRLWGTSGSNVYAVGLQGAIVHFDGKSWTPMEVPVESDLLAIWGASGTDVFAVGDAGVILHYDGASWTSMPSPTSELLVAVWGAQGSDVFALGNEGAILHYDGVNWAIRDDLDGYYLDLWGRSATEVYVTGGVGILRMDEAGWTQIVSAPAKEALHGVTGTQSEVFAVGPRGTIVRGSDDQWVRLDSGTTEDLNAVWAAPDGKVFAVGHGPAGPTLLKYEGDGWTSMPSDVTLPASFQGVWGTSSTNVFAAGGTQNGPVVLQYDGETWASMAVPNGNSLLAIWGTSSQDIFAVGANGSILHFDGLDWTPMESGAIAWLRTVWGSSGQDVYAAGDQTLLHYDGTDWSPVTLGFKPEGQFTEMWGTSERDVFLVGSEGMILHYDGSVWRQMEAMTRLSLGAVWGRNSGSVFAVGAVGRVQHYGPHY